MAVLLLSVAFPGEVIADLVAWEDSRFFHFGGPIDVDWLWHGENHTAEAGTADWYRWEMSSGQNITITIFHQYMVSPMVGVFVSIYEDTKILDLHLSRYQEMHFVGAVYFPEGCNATTVEFTAMSDATYHLGVALHMDSEGVRIGASYVIEATRELEFLTIHDEGWAPEEPLGLGLIIEVAIIVCVLFAVGILCRRRWFSR